MKERANKPRGQDVDHHQSKSNLHHSPGLENNSHFFGAGPACYNCRPPVTSRGNEFNTTRVRLSAEVQLDSSGNQEQIGYL